METLESLNKSLKGLSNPWIITALIVGALIVGAPAISEIITRLFDSNFVKVLYLILVLVLLQYNVVLALIAALIFVLAMQNLQRYNYLQDFKNKADAVGVLAKQQFNNLFTGATNVRSNLNNLGANLGANLNVATGAVTGAVSDVASDVKDTVTDVVSDAANYLTRIPSAFSTSVGTDDVAGDGTDVEGCTIPKSCQNTCGSQPLGFTGLPPTENTVVTGLCGCDSEGPQGLRFPLGYENLGMGYNIKTAL